MRRLSVAVLVLVLGCSRRSTDVAPDAAVSSDAAVAPYAAPPAPSASSAPLAADDPNRKILSAWNEALDRHDVAALERLYGPTVIFYGSPLPRATVLELKRRALGPRSSFHQSIVGAVTSERLAEGRTLVSFVKRSGTDTAKMRDVKAGIVVRDGLVVEELDETTKPRLMLPAVAGSEPPSPCESVAAQAVGELPAVKKITADAARAVAKHPGTTVGGLGPIGEPGGGFSMSLGVHHADRYEAQLWYTVDADGHLEVIALGETLTVPPASLAAVERACKKP